MARDQSQSAYQPANLAYGARSRPDDSWVEVSSRPSSSSLSSIGDEVITTGLRVQQPPTISRRNRRLRRSLPDNARLGTEGRQQTTSSSQEEYDESESESDPVLSSSGEGLQPRSSVVDQRRGSLLGHSRQPQSYASEDGDADDDDDDDENATAVGTAGTTTFTPQPSAFSHPPRLSRHSSSSMPQSRTRRPSAHSYQRHSFSAQQQHSPYNLMSPSHQIDHEAALRASLSTLLSYAAATRGVPKSTGNGVRQQELHPSSNRIQPGTIGLMPESMAFPEPAAAAMPQEDLADKGKRKAATNATATGNVRSGSKDRRAIKKRRSNTDAVTGLEGVSPTLLTWVVGAGMIVLVSAISFSAGYVVGRETGHAEATAGMGEVGAGVVKRQLVAAKGSGLGLRRIAAGAAA